MTPHSRPVKSRVGVRELHDQLSRYVRHVADGGDVVVTMRGRAVARLSPVADDDPLGELRSRGLVRDPIEPWSPKTGGRPRATGSVADLVHEQRR